MLLPPLRSYIAPLRLFARLRISSGHHLRSNCFDSHAPFPRLSPRTTPHHVTRRSAASSAARLLAAFALSFSATLAAAPRSASSTVTCAFCGSFDYYVAFSASCNFSLASALAFASFVCFIPDSTSPTVLTLTLVRLPFPWTCKVPVTSRTKGPKRGWRARRSACCRSVLPGYKAFAWTNEGCEASSACPKAPTTGPGTASALSTPGPAARYNALGSTFVGGDTYVIKGADTGTVAGSRHGSIVGGADPILRFVRCSTAPSDQKCGLNSGICLR